MTPSHLLGQLPNINSLFFLKASLKLQLEMFYLNTIDQLFLFVVQLDQLEVFLPYRRLLAGIPTLAVFQNLRWNSNKTPLFNYSASYQAFHYEALKKGILITYRTI